MPSDPTNRRIFSFEGSTGKNVTYGFVKARISKNAVQKLVISERK